MRSANRLVSADVRQRVLLAGYRLQSSSLSIMARRLVYAAFRLLLFCLVPFKTRFTSTQAAKLLSPA